MKSGVRRTVQFHHESDFTGAFKPRVFSSIISAGRGAAQFLISCQLTKMFCLPPPHTFAQDVTVKASQPKLLIQSKSLTPVTQSVTSYM